MSTEFINDQWRLPNEENKSKVSNYSMDFDSASSDYIDCGDDDIFSFGNSTTDSPFSISTWVKFSSTNTSEPIVSKYGTEGNREYMLLLFNQKVRLYVSDTTGFNVRIKETNATININSWYHICATYNGVGGSNAQNGINIYVNGVLQSATGLPFGNYNAMSNTTQPVEIGRYNDDTYFDGKIDAVAIFNYELSSSQITTLYGSSSTGIGNPITLNPVAYYQLGDKSAFNGANYLVPNIAAQEDDGDIAASYSPYALDFDGTNDYINIASAGGIALMNTGVSSTVSLWVYPTGTSTRVFFEQKSTGRYVIYQSGTSLFFYPNSARASFTNLILNQWYNVTTIVDGSNSKFYVNGNEVGTSTSYTPVNTLGVLQFGRSPAGIQYFEGKLSNVSIWNTALTSSQVTEIYNEGVPSNLNNHSAYSNLVSWWQLGSNSSFNTNWTVLDEKGSNNGTSVNMTEADIVDGVGSYANGVSSGMSDNIVGDAFGSSANSLSYNMDVLDRTEDTPS